MDAITPVLTRRRILYGAIGLFVTWALYTRMYSGDEMTSSTGQYNEPPPSRPTFYPGSVYPGGHAPVTWPGRAEAVRDAFKHAYHGYERHAAPADELLPLSDQPTDNFNGWGVTLFDSLDTMILMNLTDELLRARPVVERASFAMPRNQEAPFFETVIRYLGGLLSAHALTGDSLYLRKADTLGELLSPAFDTTSGFPVYSINTNNGKGSNNQIGSLAEIASCQLEYMYLAKVTGKKEHYDRANGVLKALGNANLTETAGMLPTRFNLSSGQPLGSHLTVGALADSTHEYLLKYYLMTARTHKESLEMYLRFTTELIADLLYVSPTRDLMYVTDVDGVKRLPSHVFEHLSTFAAGLFALGAHLLPLDNLSSLGIDFQSLSSGFSKEIQATYTMLSHYNLSEVHRWIAEGLATTAWLTYADMESGCAGDEMLMHDVAHDSGRLVPSVRAKKWLDLLEKWSKDGKKGIPPGLSDKKPRVYSPHERSAGPTSRRSRDYGLRRTDYLLRPETVESFYVMWRTTGDIKWREYGWSVFESIQKGSRTESGFASIYFVDASPAPKKDDMPSFFLAETLKYLYLLFLDEEKIPLDKWVLNTEAHPFPIFEWTAAEKVKFGIV